MSSRLPIILEIVVEWLRESVPFPESARRRYFWTMKVLSTVTVLRAGSRPASSARRHASPRCYEAEFLGQVVLVVEQQAILTSAEHEVQADAQMGEVILAGFHSLMPSWVMTPLCNSAQVEPNPVALAIQKLTWRFAQAAWRLLAVRFQAVRRLVEVQVTLLLLQALGFGGNKTNGYEIAM